MSPRSRLNWMDRSEVEALLYAVGIACYESETTDELRDAVAANIEDGTIPEDALDQYIGQRPTDP